MKLGIELICPFNFHELQCCGFLFLSMPYFAHYKGLTLKEPEYLVDLKGGGEGGTVLKKAVSAAKFWGGLGSIVTPCR